MGKQSEGKEIEIFGAVMHVLLVVGMIISLTIHDNRIANAPVERGVDVATATASEEVVASGEAVTAEETATAEETVIAEAAVTAEETAASKEAVAAVGEKSGDAEVSSSVSGEAAAGKNESTTDTKNETGTSSSVTAETKNESASNVAANTDSKSEDKSDTKVEETTDSKTKTDTKVDEKTDSKSETNTTVADQTDNKIDNKSEDKTDAKNDDQKSEKKKDKSTSKGSSSKNSILQDIITGYVGFRIWDHVEYIDDMTVYHLKDTTEFDPGFYKDLYGDVLGEHGFVSYEDMLKHYEQYGREELRYTTKESYETVTETEENTSDQSNADAGKKETEVVTDVYEFVIDSVNYDGKACNDYNCNMNNGQPVRVAYEFTYRLDAKGPQQELLSAKLAEGEPAGFGLTLKFGTAGDTVTFSWVTFNSLTAGKTPDRSGSGAIGGVTTSGKPVRVTFRYRIQ